MAAIAYISRRHRVPVVKEMPTESEEAAQRRVTDAVTGNGMVLVMQMRSMLFKHSLLHPKELISMIRLTLLKMAKSRPY